MTSTSKHSQRDRLAGGLQGLLIGDAIGVPYEFKAPGDLPERGLIDLQPPIGFARSHVNIPPGTWSDDGAQALCLLESLLSRGTLDLEDFVGRLLAWFKEGHLAVGGHVFDIGIQTATALEQLDQGMPIDEAAPRGEFDNGNGALMRVLPLALWHQGDETELITLAGRQALPTHGHPRSAVACAMLCLWARSELAGAADAWTEARKVLLKHGKAAGLPQEEVERVLDPGHADRIQGSGYVVDTLWSARHAVEKAHDFEETVRTAIALGNDTDTTAAVAGGIAGIRYGLYGIPLRWRQGLRGKELFEPLQARLIAHATGEQAGTSGAPRTSQTHPLQIGTLGLPSGGRIGITFCPGKKQSFAMSGRWDRDLDRDLAAIKAWGASHLVTLVTDEEMRELGVTALAERAAAHGITWYHAPILDGHIPGVVPEGADPACWFEGVWPALSVQLQSALAAGEGVVVHCKGGLGRAGTVATLLLAAQNPSLSAREAIAQVREARPDAVETVVQEQYLLAMVDR